MRIGFSAFLAFWLSGFLAACGQSDALPDHSVQDARTELAMAAAMDSLGEPIDVAALAAMPGMDQALKDKALAGRPAVLNRLKDPTSPLFGETWTVNYGQICGTVNARNSFGAYSGPARYVIYGDTLAVIEGMPEFSAVEWAKCEGDRHLILPADAPSTGSTGS